jgi:hypothetical protein
LILGDERGAILSIKEWVGIAPTSVKGAQVDEFYGGEQIAEGYV